MAAARDHGARSRPSPRRVRSGWRSTGARFASVARELVAAERSGGRAGRSTPSSQQRLGAAADIEAAFRTALRCLGAPLLCPGDLGRRLQRKGHPPEAVEAALERPPRWASGRCRLRPQLRADSERHGAGGRPAHSRSAGHGGPAPAHRPRAGGRVAGGKRSARRCRSSLATKRAAQLGALPRQTKRRRRARLSGSARVLGQRGHGDRGVVS